MRGSLTIRRTVLSCVTLVLLFATVSASFPTVVQCQSEVPILRASVFRIPEFNATIRFAANGTCSSASLKDGTWDFVNIALGNLNSTRKLNLTVSARDCNVTIIAYQRVNSSFAGTPASNVRLRYNVTGVGTQIFNFHLNPNEGNYSVIADGVFIGLFDGWNISKDSAITITGERHNVTISYFGIPTSELAFRSQPFYAQHSVVLTTVAVLVGTVVGASVLRVVSRERSRRSRVVRFDTELVRDNSGRAESGA